MFKKCLFQIHWFCGITAGLILSLMGITGAIFSYDQTILRWINHDSYVVAVQNQPKLTPAQLYQRFSQAQPQAKINSITVSSVATEASTVNIAKEGARRGVNIMVNPYTAQPLPALKGQEFFQFIQQLHRNLTLGAPGKQITGACTLMLIFFVLSGLYLRWPRKHSVKQWLWLKPQLKGRNFIWDLHAVVGTWVLIFYLIFAITGLTWSYSWWRNGLYAVMGVERPQMMHGAPTNQGGNAKNNNQRGKVQTANPQQQKQQHDTPLSSAQITQALQQTWQGFQQNIGREYSTLTLNIPKNMQTVEISFVDKIPQHERARNSAVYHLQSGLFDKIDLYENKALNVKIMSSMLPVHRGSFFGSVYQFFAMLASLAMPLFFITGWMLYLKRRRQKRQTLQARRQHQGDADYAADQTWQIYFASQTGTAEQLAYETAKRLQQADIHAQVLPLAQCKTAQLQQATQPVLFIVSTYGTGDAPDNAVHFAHKIMTKTADLSSLSYAVLALGSQEFPETFCAFGKRLDQWLQQQHAKPLLNTLCVSNGEAADISQWYQALAQHIGQHITTDVAEKTFNDWQLTQRECLNVGSLGEPIYQITLQPLQAQTWHAGDIVEVQCGNDQQTIEHFIRQQGLSISDIELLRYKNLRQLPPQWQHDITQLHTLPTREYSIATITQDGVIQLVIRQKIIADDFGLGSGWLTHHAPLNHIIPLRIRNNSTFHLNDHDKPAIFIGNGTGIAGLLSLIKQRELIGQRQNWLIFGERQRQTDFLYQQQIEHWLQTQHLTHVDLAFSRDQPQRIYVQDVLLQQAERLQQWIDQGADIYVCGSLDGMASGVDLALKQILGEETVMQLLAQQRYRRDVY